MNDNLLQLRKKLKKKFRQRKRMFGGWISYCHPSITETFARMNIDFIAIDMEHSTISSEQAQRIISASQGLNVPCLPRPVSQSNDIFKPILESGCDGLIVSTVENFDQLNLIVNNFKYPPIGKRPYGVNRAQGYGHNTNEYYDNWNYSSSLILQIENLEGLNNSEQLIKNKYVDGIMIGPYDLSGSLGIPGDFKNKAYEDACKYVINLSKKYKKSCGTQIANVSKDLINYNFKLGFNFIVLGSDLFALTDWASNINKIISKIVK
tara:strand:- start:3446 stop:4237 length:792 start_codon:yes stop_codon:yes gene_type:complete